MHVFWNSQVNWVNDTIDKDTGRNLHCGMLTYSMEKMLSFNFTFNFFTVMNNIS